MNLLSLSEKEYSNVVPPPYLVNFNDWSVIAYVSQDSPPEGKVALTLLFVKNLATYCVELAFISLTSHDPISFYSFDFEEVSLFVHPLSPTVISTSIIPIISNCFFIIPCLHSYDFVTIPSLKPNLPDSYQLISSKAIYCIEHNVILILWG